MRARVEVIRDFLSPDEKSTLNEWAETAVQNKWLDVSTAAGVNRLTTRMYGDRFETPAVALDVFDRIRSLFGLSDAPIIEGHGRDGVVVAYTYPGGSVIPHYDPTTPQGAALRCNIITQSSDGGDLYVDGARVSVGEGDLHCYAVSAWPHWVEEVTGSTPRIVWMFGLGVSLEDWEDGVIKMEVAE